MAEIYDVESSKLGGVSSFINMIWMNKIHLLYYGMLIKELL